jgi:hypothetical protein
LRELAAARTIPTDTNAFSLNAVSFDRPNSHVCG